MAEKDDKAKKEVKKEVAKKEPEVNPKKKAVKKKEEVKAPEKKVKDAKKEPEEKVKETVKKEEEKVQKDTEVTIKANNGAVDTAPESVKKKKKKKNGLVVFLTIIVFLLIAAIGFFAILYYTDSDILKNNSSSATKEEKSNKAEKNDKLVAIDSEKFEEVFSDVKWTVTDLTKYINHSEDTAIEVLTAVEAGNTSSASYSLFENEKDARQFYEDTIERLKDVFGNTFDELKKDETSGKNWDKYIIQTANKNEIGYAAVLRVDDTVFVISTETDVNKLNQIMENLGY